MIWVVMFGIICFKMIFTWLTPRVFAAMTKSLSFKVSVWARTILATPVQENRASISRPSQNIGTELPNRVKVRTARSHGEPA